VETKIIARVHDAFSTTASGDPITNGSLSQSTLSRSFPFASKDATGVRPAQEGKRGDRAAKRERRNGGERERKRRKKRRERGKIKGKREESAVRSMRLFALRKSERLFFSLHLYFPL